MLFSKYKAYLLSDDGTEFKKFGQKIVSSYHFLDLRHIPVINKLGNRVDIHHPKNSEVLNDLRTKETDYKKYS